MSDFILAYNIMIFVVIFTTVQALIVYYITSFKFKWPMDIMDFLFLLFSPTGGYRVYLMYKHRYCNRYDIPKDLSLLGIKKYRKKRKRKNLNQLIKSIERVLKLLLKKVIGINYEIFKFFPTFPNCTIFNVFFFYCI